MTVETPQTRAPSGVPLRLSVVLPVYNEEATLKSVLLEHLDTLRAAAGYLADWEIVCVDDASSDRTPVILEHFAARFRMLKIVRHSENLGIYQSFADGFAVARGTHIYATAADGQWPAKNLTTMLEAVVAGADLVVGVRSNLSEVYGPRRRFVSYMFNVVPRVLFGVETVDAGGIKLGLREVFTCELVSRSPFAEAERIIKACRDGYRVSFVPVAFEGRQEGKASGACWPNVLASIRDGLKCARIYDHGPGRSVLLRAERCSR